LQVTRFRVLFVCIGNVCRSPLGQHLLAARLPAEQFEVSSAGVGALVGEPMNAEAALHLEPHGITADGFAARQLTADIVADSDLILTATRAIRSRLLEDSPRALRRTFTVLEFAALLDTVPNGEPAEVVAGAAEQRSRAVLGDYDIPDPYGRGESAHRLAAEEMLAAVERIAKGLAP
jgi:protein-tyrosine phosphatase